MTHISRKKFEKQAQESLDQAITHIFKNLKPNEVKSLLATLLTKTEKVMLLKRLGIITLLDQKIPEVNIAKITSTTRQTVTRIRLQLLEIAEDDKKILARKMKSFTKIAILKDLVKQFSKIDISKSAAYKKIRKGVF